MVVGSRLKLHLENRARKIGEWWGLVQNWGWIGGRTKRTLGEQRRTLGILKLLARKPGYGSWTPIFLVRLNNYMISMITWLHNPCFNCKFLISGNFPETGWRAIHSRQATHPLLCVSGFPWGTTWRWSHVPLWNSVKVGKNGDFC